MRFNPGIPDAELAHDRPPSFKALTRSTPGVKGNRDANERLRVDPATWQFHARWFGWLATGEGGSATGEREPTRDAGQSGPRPYRGAKDTGKADAGKGDTDKGAVVAAGPSGGFGSGGSAGGGAGQGGGFGGGAGGGAGHGGGGNGGAVVGKGK